MRRVSAWCAISMSFASGLRAGVRRASTTTSHHRRSVVLPSPLALRRDHAMQWRVLPPSSSSSSTASFRRLATAVAAAEKTTCSTHARRIEVSVGATKEFRGDAIVVPVFAATQDAKAETTTTTVKAPKKKLPLPFAEGSAAAAVDADFGGFLSELVAEQEFEAKSGSISARVAGGPTKTIALFGAGKEILGASSSPPKDGDHTPAVVGPKASSSSLAAKLGKLCAELSMAHKARTIGVCVDDLGDTAAILKETEFLEAMALAATEGCYVDNRFRTGDAAVDAPPLISLVALSSSSSDDAHNDVLSKEAGESAAGLAAGVAFARDIVQAPANVVTPKSLAETALALRDAYPDVLDGKVLSAAECESRGMGAYLGVARGASVENEAHFIHLSYKGPSTATTSGDENVKSVPKLALVGKGLTYDSGGYNLKPSSGGMIELMKFDCGGSAAVLGAAKALCELRVPDVQVDIIVAACENMISADAMRPGDILTASNGKTIEVINTDAEGRLTLADALVYAQKECQPDAIVDLATLTGAMIVALGDTTAGLFTPSDALADELHDAAKRAGEKIWRMPLEPEYEEQIKSKIADLKNVGGRAAGSITAALFLNHFVDHDLPWAHLDIAGPVWNGKTDQATGYGVKTLIHWIRAKAAAS